MSEDLKPCPFCGSNALELQNLVGDDDFFVSCEDCGIQQIANHTSDEAVQKWNRRAA
jgi:Lar family restriction alleviation protein